MTRQELENIQFEWDERKATSNLAKHGVSFADAGLVFFDEHALIEPNDNSEGEGRFQVIGLAAGLLLLSLFIQTGIIMAKKQSASSPPAKQLRMSGADISKHGRKSSTRKRLERLVERPDSEIDLSEIPEMTEKQLSCMVPLQDYLEVRRKKERLTVRIDKDVVAWLRSGGEGYQTRLNEILRNAMAGSRKAGK